MRGRLQEAHGIPISFRLFCSSLKHCFHHEVVTFGLKTVKDGSVSRLTRDGERKGDHQGVQSAPLTK
jgi:hypothetical protein